MTDNIKGIVFIVLAMGFFVASDATAKAAMTEISWQQVFTMRSGVATIFCLGLAITLDGFIKPRVFLGYFSNIQFSFRVICELLATILFLQALLHTTLASAIAINQITPIIVMLGGILFFVEKLSWAKALVFLFSCLGVLMIIDPYSVDFNIGAVYALFGSAFMAGRDLVTKALKATIPSSYVATLTIVAMFTLSLLLMAP